MTHSTPPSAPGRKRIAEPHPEFNFADQAIVKFEDIGAVHYNGSTVFVELSGDDPKGNRRYIQVRLTNINQARDLVKAYREASERFYG